VGFAFTFDVLYHPDVCVFRSVWLAKDGFQKGETFFELLVDEERGIEDLWNSECFILSGGNDCAHVVADFRPALRCTRTDNGHGLLELAAACEELEFYW